MKTLSITYTEEPNKVFANLDVAEVEWNSENGGYVIIDMKTKEAQTRLHIPLYRVKEISVVEVL